MRLIFENMMAKAATHKLSGEYTIAQNLATVVTGKEDANFSVPNGKYMFPKLEHNHYIALMQN